MRETKPKSAAYMKRWGRILQETGGPEADLVRAVLAHLLGDAEALTDHHNLRGSAAMADVRTSLTGPPTLADFIEAR
jgi:hypothetical protein